MLFRINPAWRMHLLARCVQGVSETLLRQAMSAVQQVEDVADTLQYNIRWKCWVEANAHLRANVQIIARGSPVAGAAARTEEEAKIEVARRFLRKLQTDPEFKRRLQ